MTLSEFSLRRPVTVVMAFVSLLVLGAISLNKLSLEWLPHVDIPEIYVAAAYPNSHPKQVERDVVKPLEEALATLKGLRSISSECQPDEGVVSLEFDWGQPIDLMRLEVSEKVEQARASFPAGAGPVFIYSFNTSDIPVLEARISAPGVDLTDQYAMLETLVKNRLERVPGVARVDLQGVTPKQIYIDLRLDKIIEHGVDVSALVGRLSTLNADVSAGRVTDKGTRYTVRSLGALHTVRDYEDILVNERGLRLRDIADVQYTEPALNYGRRLDREYAVAVSVYKESTANTVRVAREAARVIKEDISTDPRLRNIGLFVFNDQAKDITEGLRGLLQTGLFGGLLAMGVLYLFLRRMRPTLIMMAAMPLSIVAAFTLVYLLGHTLNILSMMGLMLGVGMLVDNSIVVLENISRHRAMGASAAEASRAGSAEVNNAVLASTLTSIIVFLPLIVGKTTEISVWLGEMGISYSLTLLCSLLAAVTLIPLLAARMLRGEPATGTGGFFTRLQDRHGAMLRWTFRHPWRTGALLLLLVASMGVPQHFLSKEEEDRDTGVRMRPVLSYEFSDFRYKSQVEKVVAQVEDFLYGRQDEFLLESVYTFYEENRAFSVLTMREDADKEAVNEVKKKIRDGLPKFPGVELGFWNFGGGGVGKGDTRFSIYLFGDDTELLRGIAGQVERQLQGLEGLTDVRAGDKFQREEVQVSIDPEAAMRHRITPQEISNIFYFTLGGQRLRRFRTAEREVDVSLGLRVEDRQNIEDMKKMVVRSVEGRGVPLGAMARFETARKPTTIRRQDRKTVASVAASYEGKDRGKFMMEVRKRLNRMALPPGYSWSFSGGLEREDEERGQMAGNIWLALLLVYLVIASLFESLLHPFAVLFTVPFALVGVMWGLFLTGTPFNIMAMIGMLLLLGIVVNNGIVLIDHVNHLRREGLSREQALERGCRERLRAVLMTALTTILGLMPMAVGGSGIGGAYYYPLARTVMTGLAFSTVLTLLVLPYIYTLLDKAAAWLRTVRSGAAPPLPAADSPSL